MNFYQSWLRKTINSTILGKPVIDIELFGKQYWGTLKQQKHLWKTLRRRMIQGVQFEEGITQENRNKQVAAIRSQIVHGRWDFLIQVWCVNVLDSSPTKLVKNKETQNQLHDTREKLQLDLLQKYSLEKWLRTHLPDATIVLDLTLDEKEYRKQLSTSGKRYINKWKKAELVFEQATSDQREEFRDVRYKTGYDKWFHVLPKDQFLKLREYCLSEKKGTLFIWLKDDKIVTWWVYLYYGKQMIYLYGWTDRAWGDIWAQYRLTDQIIRRGKEEKYTSLDLLGVAPVGFEKGHDRAWVTRFKQAFGGETISYRGSYDLIFNTWVMKAFEWKRKMRR
jgi:hypothetical protein